MISRLDPDGAAPALRVRMLAWGRTALDVDQAVKQAQLPRSRAGWNFAQIDRVEGAMCPIDVHNPDRHALVVDGGHGWAYEISVLRNA